MNSARSRRTWIIAGALLIGLFVGGIGVATSRSLPELSTLFGGVSVEPVTYSLRKLPFTVKVPAAGELETVTATHVSVPNVRTGGLKVFWIIKDGSLVKKGETLVEFDASELLQQMDETNNSLAAALRQLEASVLRSASDTGHITVDRQIAEMELDKAQTQAPRDSEIFTRHQIIEGELNVGLSKTKVTEWTGKVDTRKNIGSASQRILVIDRKQQESKRACSNRVSARSRFSLHTMGW